MSKSSASQSLMTVEETADLLGVAVATLYDWAAHGVVPSVKVGRLRRFRAAEIERWLDEHSQHPTSERRLGKETASRGDGDGTADPTNRT